MLGHKKPESVKELGGHPIEWAALEDGQWIVAFDGELAVTSGGEQGELQRHSWSEFETASWSEENRRIILTYVDGSAPLVVHFEEGEKQKIAYVVRERLQRSIVFQQGMDLPSGAAARGMVRRAGDESLFTQVIIDGQTGPEDDDAIAELERSLRDVTGISDDQENANRVR